MNIRILSYLVLSAALTVPSLLLAFEPPSESTINKMLANPNMVDAVFEGASAEEAAEALTAVITAIEESNLNESQKLYNKAFFTIKVLALLPNEGKLDFATALLESTEAEDRSTLLAALSIGGRGNDEFFDGLEGLADPENYVEVQAIKFPQIPLSGKVYGLLTASLSNSRVSFPPVAALYSGQQGNN